MLFRQLTIASLFLTSAAAGVSSVDACSLTDRLYGRQASAFAANYPPVYTSGFAPVAGVAPVGISQPNAAGFAPSSASVTALPATTSAFSSGAFQVQRPAYYNNPSVFTGAPVGTNLQTSFSVPVTSTPQLLRGNRPFLAVLSSVQPTYFRTQATTHQTSLPPELDCLLLPCQRQTSHLCFLTPQELRFVVVCLASLAHSSAPTTRAVISELRSRITVQ